MNVQVVLPMDETVIPSSGKISESGMPPEEVWSSLFSIEEILKRMRIDSEPQKSKQLRYPLMVI
jgi:hypothetical protein